MQAIGSTVDSCGFNREDATFRHRIPRVNCEIEQHELQLRCVNQSRPKILLCNNIDTYCRTESARQQFRDRAHQFVGIDRLWSKTLLARECQELLNKLSAALRSMHRIADMLLDALVSDPSSNQFETSHDHH